MTSIRTFRVNPSLLATLTASEKKMLPILIEAAKAIDKIFCLQENSVNNGANFYPRDATKTEISEEAQKNSKIFSPFTIVKRNDGGKLITIDYHIEYKKELAPIAKLLKKSAKISENVSFANYLIAAADALVSGNYSQADKAWTNTKKNNLDIVIGPYERYLDKLFFIKRAYQSSVCIIDHEKSEKASVIRNIIYATVSPNTHRIISPTATDIQVRESFIFAGFLGRALFTQQHLPSDSDSVERYGSRILGFQSSLNYKFDKLIYPIFCAVFEKSFRERYTKDLIKKGSYYRVLLSGIVQHLHRYRNSRTRLKELFPIFDEANVAASGIQHAKHLVLKGVMDQKELEAMMIAQICWGFSEFVNARKNSTRDVYLKGDAMIFNFLKREGALLEKDGISWPNFAKMFFEMENLSTIFTRILEEGNYMDAQEFLAKYLSLDALKAFELKLSEIKPI